MALEFEAYKKQNKVLVDDWVKTYPELNEMLPIYWNNIHRKWLWRKIDRRSIMIYIKMCESFMMSRGQQ